MVIFKSIDLTPNVALLAGITIPETTSAVSLKLGINCPLILLHKDFRVKEVANAVPSGDNKLILLDSALVAPCLATI